MKKKKDETPFEAHHRRLLATIEAHGGNAAKVMRLESDVKGHMRKAKRKKK